MNSINNIHQTQKPFTKGYYIKINYLFMRNLFLSVAAVALLASCSQNEIQEMTSMSKEIKFATLNDKVSTRAANDDKQSYQVYASSSLGGYSWFMADVLTTGSVITGNDFPSAGFENYTSGDQPTKPHYWPNVTGDWTIKFFAYAPATFSATNTRVDTVSTYNDASVSIAYSVPTDAQEDFTIATPVTATKTGTTLPSQNVHFQFKHMLSKIKINAPVLGTGKVGEKDVNLTEAGYSIEYSTCTLNVAASTGTINAVYTTTEPTWTTTATPTNYSGTIDATNGYTANIMPQTSTGTTIILPIVIKKNGAIVYDGDIQYTIAETNVEDNEFKQGKIYNLTLTINGEGGNIFGNLITFSSEEAVWVNEDVTVPQPADKPVVQQ